MRTYKSLSPSNYRKNHCVSAYTLYIVGRFYRNRRQCPIECFCLPLSFQTHQIIFSSSPREREKSNDSLHTLNSVFLPHWCTTTSTGHILNAIFASAGERRNNRRFLSLSLSLIRFPTFLSLSSREDAHDCLHSMEEAESPVRGKEKFRSAFLCFVADCKNRLRMNLFYCCWKKGNIFSVEDWVITIAVQASKMY